MFPDCPYFHLTFLLLPKGAPSHGFYGTVLRSALGRALHEIACTKPMLESCDTCPVEPKQCAYRTLLETPISIATSPSHLLRKQNVAPRPIIVTPHLADTIPALTVVGVGPHAFTHAPALVEAVRLMGRYGLGSFRYTVTTILARTEYGEVEWSPVDEPPLLSMASWNDPAMARSWGALLQTPLLLKNEGRMMTPRTFSPRALIRGLMLRASLMTELHCGRSLKVEPGRILDEVQKGELTAVHLFRYTGERYSARQGSTHPLVGLTGSFVLDAPVLAEIAPLLRAAPYLHAGKYATYGFGRILFYPVED